MNLDEVLAKSFPLVDAYFRQNSGRTLYELYDELFLEGCVPDDAFIDASRLAASRIYGDDGALLCAKALSGGRIFAAGHCGFENHPQLIASTLCALAAKSRGTPGIPPVHVALSCSSITPSNATVPCGMLLGRLGAEGRRIKVNLSPSRVNSSYLDSIPAFGKEEARRALAKAEGCFNAREIGALKTLCDMCAASGADDCVTQAALVDLGGTLGVQIVSMGEG